MTAELQLIVLGRPRIQKDGQPLADLVSAKAQALLVYLAVTGKTASRSALAGLLWGDMPEETARANLRLALSKLRKTVGDHLTITWETVAFNPTLPYRLDSADFLAGARLGAGLEPASPDQLLAAMRLYQGDFLEDFVVPNAPEFESWMTAERERLRQVALKGWWQLAALARGRDDTEAGIEATRQVLRLEPWHEEAHQQLLGWLARTGQHSAALAQFEVCRRVLAEELGVDPSPATVALVAQIQSERAAAPLPAQRAAPASGLPATPLPRHNLPGPLTPLIGRETEQAQVVERLADPECRLLTLIGPGGIGKTRLAIAAAEMMAASLREPPDEVGRVVWAAFEALSPAGAVEAMDALVNGIANALGYTFAAPQSPRDLLLAYLADKTMLLVLDNLEGVRAGGRLLADLLRRAPGVKILATSRERLGVAGEWIFQVEGLPFAPAATEYASARYPAVQLFAQGARRIRSDFDPAAEAVAINRICQLVDGSPLAIELAARWAQVLSCAQIAARLSRNLDLLSAADSSVGRHASLQAVLVDSWAVLNEAERRAFRRLATCQGGFDLAAAEQIAGATLPVLAGLADKSWLRRDGATGGEGRFRVHELLRQYGAEQLAAQPEERAAALDAHCRHYAEFLRARAAILERRPDPMALAELDLDAGNLRAAADWLLTGDQRPGRSDRLASFLDSLWLYYQRKGWFSEAISIFERALRPGSATYRQQGRWQLRLGQAHYQMGRIAQSEEHLARALALLGQPLPKTEGAWLLHLLGHLARRVWPRAGAGLDPDQRLVLLDAMAALNQLGPITYQSGEALPTLTAAVWNLNLAEQSGVEAELAKALGGCCITTGSLPLHRLAETYAQRALHAARSGGDPAAEAYAAELVALYWLGTGRWAEAQAALERTAALCVQLELRRNEIEARCLLAKVHYHQGRFEEARRIHAPVLAASQELGDPAGIHWSLLGLVDCAARLGQASDDEALAWLEQAQAVQTARSLALADVIRCHGMLALWHSWRGDQQRAQEAAQTAARLTRRNRLAGVWTLEGFAGVAEVCLARWEAARLNGGEAHGLAASAQEACQALQGLARIFPVARPRAWLYQGWRHWLAGQPARAARAWHQSLAVAERLAMPYEQGRAHYELGRRVNTARDAFHLQQACEIFAGLQATMDQERAARALAEIDH